MPIPPLLHKIKWLTLLTGDIAVLYLSLWLTLSIRYNDNFLWQAWNQHILPFTILYALWIVVFYAFGLYSPLLAKNNVTFFLALIKALGVCAFLGIVLFYLVPAFDIAPKTNLAINLFFILILFSVWRHGYNLFIRYPFLSQNILVVGTNPQSRELAETIHANPQMGYTILEIPEPDQRAFLHFIKKERIHTVLIAFQHERHPEFLHMLFEHLSRFPVQDFSAFYERISGRIPISRITESWFLGNLQESDKSIHTATKIVFDTVCGLVLGVLLVVFLPIVAFAITLDSPGPLFYSQVRVGKNGKMFRLWKLRSMIDSAENGEALWAQKHDPRITRVGKILRKTFLDELPQCINLLRGEMSFVGPRPERPEFVQHLAKQIPFYHIRHLVKPGITGWAQVNTSYGSSTEDALEKLQYDLYYIKHRSFMLDLKILLKTVNIIFKGGTQ